MNWPYFNLPVDITNFFYAFFSIMYSLYMYEFFIEILSINN